MTTATDKMTDTYPYDNRSMLQQHHQGGPHNQHWNHESRSHMHQVVKAATAATAGGSLLVLSGLTLAGTVIALIVATPLLVLFSPVLVPALISVFLLATGFLACGGFGVAAATVLVWLFKYVTGEHPAGSDSLDQASHKLGSKAREIRDKGEYVAGGGSYSTGGGVYGSGAGGGNYSTTGGVHSQT